MNLNSPAAVNSGALFRSVGRRIGLVSLFIAALLVSSVMAQGTFDYAAERKRAFEMVEQNNLLAALPVLEKLAAAKPDDAEVLERLALALVSSAVTQKQGEERKQALLRARALAQKVKDSGYDSRIAQVLLEKIPADGNLDDGGTKRTPADEALMEGERAFASGDMEGAIASYEKAAKLDPKLYEAPLYIGDAYFKLKKIDEAGKAYARAIAIDADRETAYRYWGNVLMQDGHLKEAREKFIEAIIAEPYNKAPWQFLVEWGRRSNVQLTHARIEIPASVEVSKKDNKTINLTLMAGDSDKKDGSFAWTVYGMHRALWKTDDKKFREAYPSEKQYRHSLSEEAGALRLTAETLLARIKDGEVKEAQLSPALATLLKLHRAGLIEAWVLLAVPDEGIAQDYAAYRREHRDKLRQYLTDYVTAGSK